MHPKTEKRNRHGSLLIVIIGVNWEVQKEGGTILKDYLRRPENYTDGHEAEGPNAKHRHRHRGSIVADTNWGQLGLVEGM